MNLGSHGERLAQAYYEERGYHLFKANYRTRYGEVDLILQKDALWVFAEVKTRSASALARPAAFVDARKQEKLRKTVLLFLQEQALCEPNLRFDVVEVFFDKEGNYQLECIENAF